FQKPQILGKGGKAHTLADMAVLVEYRLTKAVEGEAATALPSHGLGNAALLAVDHLLQARLAVGDRMVAHLDTDIAAVHFMGDGGGGAGAEEGVEHQVARIRGCLQN